ncbi:MAG: oligosaccharide flippase family protein [Rhodobacteraceae bacterium]|nr:oligosaccharide flippase family protein [Paracoccaceae bacterium]
MTQSNRGARLSLANGAILAAGNWADAILRLLTTVILTRQLGVASYGVWAYAMAVSGFMLGVASFGLDRLVPLSLGARRSAAGEIAADTLAVRAITASLCFIGLLLFALAFEQAGETRVALLIISLHFMGRAFYSWARPVFVGLERVGIVIGLTLVMRCLELLVLAMILMLGASVLLVLAASAAFACIEAALVVLAALKRLPRLRFPMFAGIKAVVMGGAVLGLADMLTQGLMTGPLILLRSSGASMADIGQVGLVFQVSTLAVMTIRPFVMAALPALSRAQGRQVQPRVHFGRLVALGVVALLSVGAVLAWLIGPFLIPLVFGADFGLAGRLLAPGLLIAMTILIPLGYENLLIVRERRLAVVLAGALGAVILLASSASSLEQWPITGIMLAAVLAWGVRASALIFSAAGPVSPFRA